MKFITCVLAVLFVFAIPVSAGAWTSSWKYEKSVDEDGEMILAGIVGIEKEFMVTLLLACGESEFVTTVTFIGKPFRYTEDKLFDIEARFDQKSAFDMKWFSVGGQWNDVPWSDTPKWGNGFGITLNDATHGEKFLTNLRTSNYLYLRPEKQNHVYSVQLNKSSREPLERALRDCEQRGIDTSGSSAADDTDIYAAINLILNVLICGLIAFMTYSAIYGRMPRGLALVILFLLGAVAIALGKNLGMVSATGGIVGTVTMICFCVLIATKKRKRHELSEE